MGRKKAERGSSKRKGRGQLAGEWRTEGGEIKGQVVQGPTGYHKEVASILREKTSHWGVRAENKML